MTFTFTKHKPIFLCLLCTSFAFSHQYPEPYNSIKVLPYFEQGWFCNIHRRNLINFIEELQPAIVVEVGSWLGKSTIEIAKRLKKGSLLYAVDTWLGSPEHINDPAFKQFLPTLFQQFLSNVIHQQQTHVIVPIRMTSLEAAAALKVHPQLIYLDAAHDTESVYNDIIHWYQKLAHGGIICGDDWVWDTVASAVVKAASELKIQYHHDDTFWYFDVKQ
jgi:hypothetical protein